MSKAIYCGSFAPFHLGHLNILEKAERLFDEVLLVVAQNPNKPRFHTSTKAIENDLKSHTVSNVKVVTLPERTLLVDFAQENMVGFLVRGIRGVKDADAEFEMADINRELSGFDTIETVFILSHHVYRNISSSVIRSLVGMKGMEGMEEIVNNYLPEHSAEEFIKGNSK
jgi:pantetheine-phosphate adenylyltransferase